MGLEGRVALVTGATGRGMGRSIALTLARDGADLVLNYRVRHERAAEVASVIEAMGRSALPYAAEVSDAAQVAAMFRAGEERFGKVDIVVNGAGGPWKPQDITEIEPAHFRAVMREEVDAT